MNEYIAESRLKNFAARLMKLFHLNVRIRLNIRMFRIGYHLVRHSHLYDRLGTMSSKPFNIYRSEIGPESIRGLSIYLTNRVSIDLH